MKQYEPAKPLIYIHIPKCAGTSIRSVLQSWFGKGLLLHSLQVMVGNLPLKHTPTGGQCVVGHFNAKRGFGVQDFSPEISQYVTFLRDPFENTLSFYFFGSESEG